MMNGCWLLEEEFGRALAVREKASFSSSSCSLFVVAATNRGPSQQHVPHALFHAGYTIQAISQTENPG